MNSIFGMTHFEFSFRIEKDFPQLHHYVISKCIHKINPYHAVDYCDIMMEVCNFTCDGSKQNETYDLRPVVYRHIIKNKHMIDFWLL